MQTQLKNEVKTELVDIKLRLKQELGYDSDLVIDEADEERLDKLPDL